MLKVLLINDSVYRLLTSPVKGHDGHLVSFRGGQIYTEHTVFAKPALKL